MRRLLLTKQLDSGMWISQPDRISSEHKLIVGRSRRNRRRDPMAQDIQPGIGHTKELLIRTMALFNHLMCNQPFGF